MTVRDAEFPADLNIVQTLFREYAEELGVDLCFQGFEAELASLPGQYGKPRGGLLLIEDIACGALRDRGGGVSEMKRLYVRPDARQSGCGRVLAAAIIARAAELGYREMVLDTLDRLVPAIRLYRGLGFLECDPYYANPLPGVVYMRKSLSPSTLHDP